MQLSDIISDLKLQVDDTAESPMLSADQYQSIVQRSLAKVNSYLGTVFQAQAETVTPVPDPPTLDLILAQSLVYLSETMRAKVAKNYSFKSGDKSIDKTKQPSFWADLHKDYLTRLKEILRSMAPHLDDASSLLVVNSYPLPEIFEVSLDL
jgi:hypothetical protein